MVFFSKDCGMLCLNQVQKTKKILLDNGPSNTAAEKQDRRKRDHLVLWMVIAHAPEDINEYAINQQET